MMMNPGSGLPPVVKNLLIINGLMFLLQNFPPLGLSYREVQHLFALHDMGSPLFRPWQLITYMFMHGGFQHILFNMLGLFFIGPRLERDWGSKRFFNYYMLCGIGAGLIYMGWLRIDHANALAAVSSEGLIEIKAHLDRVVHEGDNRGFTDPVLSDVFSLFYTPMVGASGALYGILLAFGMLHPNERMVTLIGFIPVPMKAKWLVILLGVGALFSSIRNTDDNIAHFAHLGGMIVGFILLKIWKRNSNGPYQRDQYNYRNGYR